MAKDIRSWDDCYDENGDINLDYTLQEHLYILGYRKLSEDSVVLSREEYERITKELVTEQRATEIAKEYFEKMRKETAEKFYDKVNENICVFQLENKNQEFTDGYAQAIADICSRLDQVAKQFGVEIKE